MEPSKRLILSPPRAPGRCKPGLGGMLVSSARGEGRQVFACQDKARVAFVEPPARIADLVHSEAEHVSVVRCRSNPVRDGDDASGVVGHHSIRLGQ